jgi:mannose/fructose/N-acetylgalactosamine-specific phosphotransferase system component IID
VTEKRKGIAPADLLQVFARSFLIQASWSFERMQSLGFAYALSPVLKRLYPDPGEYGSRLQQHMEYFNTQPYLAPFILGAVARIEEDRASGREGQTDGTVLKNALMAPLGALGDSLFWAGLKPVCALIAVSLLMTGVPWAPLLFLVLYNSGHVWVRAELLVWGYRSSGDVLSLINRYRLTSVARMCKTLSLVVLGGLFGMLPLWRPEFRPALLPAGFAAVFWLLLASALVVPLRWGGSPVKMMLGLAAGCILLASTGVV